MSEATNIPATPLPGEKPAAEKPALRVFARGELVLLPVALLFGAALTWIFTSAAVSTQNRPYFMALFWLGYLVVFYRLYWAKLRQNRVLWLVAGCCALLNLWFVWFDYRSSYGALTSWVIPAVLIAHATWMHSGRSLKQVAGIALDWLAGAVIKPLSSTPLIFDAVAFLGTKKRGHGIKKILLALAVSALLLLLLLPLLASADQVFSHFLGAILTLTSVEMLILRLIVCTGMALLFFSFLWNVGFNTFIPVVKGRQFQWDGFVLTVALSVVLAVYALFCLVQFTYLFAGAGLPAGLTYSAYAREGFWQLIAVAGINLLIYAGVLMHGPKKRSLTVILCVLLTQTGVLLASALVRLGLYVGSYGLTWLRLLSGWFILYLAAVLLLCGLRLVKERLPLVAVCALLLLGWYTALGYWNPDAQIARYNLDHNAGFVESPRKDTAYLRGLSDDARLVILQRREDWPELLKHPQTGGGLSHSSRELRRILAQSGYTLPLES